MFDRVARVFSTQAHLPRQASEAPDAGGHIQSGAQPRLQLVHSRVGLFGDPLPQLLLDCGPKPAAASGRRGGWPRRATCPQESRRHLLGPALGRRKWGTGKCEKMLGQSAAHHLSPCESERVSPALVTVPIFSHLPATEFRVSLALGTRQFSARNSDGSPHFRLRSLPTRADATG